MLQFAKNDANSEKGLLKGFSEVLSSLGHLSDVRRCGFFIGKIDTLDHYLPQSTTPLSILQNGATADEINQLCRIAKLRGMQDAE